LSLSFFSFEDDLGSRPSKRKRSLEEEESIDLNVDDTEDELEAEIIAESGKKLPTEFNPFFLTSDDDASRRGEFLLHFVEPEIRNSDGEEMFDPNPHGRNRQYQSSDALEEAQSYFRDYSMFKKPKPKTERALKVGEKVSFNNCNDTGKTQGTVKCVNEDETVNIEVQVKSNHFQKKKKDSDNYETYQKRSKVLINKLLTLREYSIQTKFIYFFRFQTECLTQDEH
jgi:hypothetical protein